MDAYAGCPETLIRIVSSLDHQIDGDCWPTELIFTLGTHNAISNKEQKMSAISNTEAIPADDPRRNLVLKDADNSDAMHLAVTGDTYTILLSGTETAGRFTLIDMHVPPGGGPPLHRHDFEETFILLNGELQATFRGEKHIVRAGETIHIPANAPHQFHNSSSQPVRMLCICSPAGQEEFFKEIGAPVATRTTPPPKVDAAQEAEFIKKVIELAPKYQIELLKEARFKA
jgi:quercetin dioxygenase-like cupin family protein